MSIVMDVEKYRREFVNRVVQAGGAMKQSELAEILDIPLSTYKSYERRSLIPHERLLPFVQILPPFHRQENCIPLASDVFLASLPKSRWPAMGDRKPVEGDPA